MGGEEAGGKRDGAEGAGGVWTGVVVSVLSSWGGAEEEEEEGGGSASSTAGIGGGSSSELASLLDACRACELALSVSADDFDAKLCTSPVERTTGGADVSALGRGRGWREAALAAEVKLEAETEAAESSRVRRCGSDGSGRTEKVAGFRTGWFAEAELSRSRGGRLREELRRGMRKVVVGVSETSASEGRSGGGRRDTPFVFLRIPTGGWSASFER